MVQRASPTGATEDVAQEKNKKIYARTGCSCFSDRPSYRANQRAGVNMRLSEAMRLGAMLKPQGFDGYNHDGATCAMGAAFDALGVLESNFTEEEHFPLTKVRCERCPECGNAPMCYTVASAIFHLNDDHEWTRERIA